MIAFVAAEAIEFSGLKKHVTETRSLSWPIGVAQSASLAGRPILMIADGPGPTRAEAALSHLTGISVEVVVSIGFCGGLSDSLRACDPFVATSVNGVVASRPTRHPECQFGPLLSVDRVIVSSEEKESLGQCGPAVVEMEAAAVQGYAAGRIPFHCVRVVTDTAQESFPIDFNEMRDNSGRFSRVRIIATAARNPVRLFPALIALERRSRRAAQVLGDFIADCQF